MLTTKQTAKRLGLTIRQLRYQIELGNITPQKPAHDLQFTEQAIADYGRLSKPVYAMFKPEVCKFLGINLNRLNHLTYDTKVLTARGKIGQRVYYDRARVEAYKEGLKPHP